MGYLLTEIVIYLVIAGLIGFVFGWAVKGKVLDKYFDKVKEEVKTKEPKTEVVDDSSKPTLLTEIPEIGADKLSSIKGIGEVLEKKLNELGVYTFEQIASWDTEQEVWIATQMAFPKRVRKEEWVKQAKELLKNK